MNVTPTPTPERIMENVPRPKGYFVMPDHDTRAIVVIFDHLATIVAKIDMLSDEATIKLEAELRRRALTEGSNDVAILMGQLADYVHLFAPEPEPEPEPEWVVCEECCNRYPYSGERWSGVRHCEGCGSDGYLRS